LNDSEPTDLQLIAAYRSSGEPAILEVFVNRHLKPVRSVIHALVLNEADADDVTQEAMLRIISGLDTFREQAAFTTWRYRVAVNTALSFIRRRNRLRARLSEVDPPDEAPECEDRAPPRMVEASELDRLITAAMKLLPPEQRAAIALVAIQGLSEREAAMACRCNFATLRWRLHRARQRLRVELGRQGALGLT
jgi:RNA polymerase sigma-70 factor (ECF subfamily)